MKKVLSIILACVFVLASVTVANAKTTTVKESKELQFNSDGKFKVMQISDLQDGFVSAPLVYDFLDKAIKAEKPDLLVLTGDNISSSAGKMGVKFLSKLSVKAAIDAFMKHLNSYDIPIAVVFGNHDAEGMIDKEEQMAMYMSYSNCVAIDEGDALYGCGTYNLPVKSSKGDKIAFNIWCVDSNMYDEERGGYDYVHDDQIQWYVDTSNALKAQNGGKVVNSLMFQHIIVNEIVPALEIPGNPVLGEVHETPCPGTYDSQQYETLVAQGDVLAIFSGHDHTNDFICPYMGVDIVNTPTGGLGSYGDNERGVRVITIDEADTSKYETNVVKYVNVYAEDQIALGICALKDTKFENEPVKYISTLVNLFSLSVKENRVKEVILNIIGIL